MHKYIRDTVNCFSVKRISPKRQTHREVGAQSYGSDIMQPTSLLWNRQTAKLPKLFFLTLAVFILRKEVRGKFISSMSNIKKSFFNLRRIKET